jgi:hypothetical protein
VAHGGRVTSRFGDIHMNSATAELNRALIEGAGSRWTTEFLGVGGVLQVRDGASIVAGGMRVGDTARALVEFESGELDAGSLGISGGQVRLVGPSEKALRARNLSFPSTSGQPNGRLDLGRNAVVVDYLATDPSPLAGLTAQVIHGRAGGDWGGNGIMSSAAAADANRAGVGIAEASDVGLESIAGIELDGTAVVARFTLLGDADLDRAVNIADFGRLAANFNRASAWSGGDFDYSGVTDIGDFSLLAGNFNQALSGGSTSAAALVPEPVTSAAVFATASAALCRRRRAARGLPPVSAGT